MWLFMLEPGALLPVDMLLLDKIQYFLNLWSECDEYT